MIEFSQRFGAPLARLARSAARVLALAGVLALGAAPGYAQTAPAAGDGATAPAENWVVQCGEAKEGAPKQCRALQNIVMKDSGQRLLTVVVEPREGAPNHAIVVALPHGVFLPAGAVIKIDDGAEQKMVIQTSDANGAYAGMAISDEMLAAMKKGQRLVIGFKTAQQQDLAIPVTLIGFTAAYNKLAQ
ncbi:MAG: invasion associated locus B family protein [Stappia sp.]|uniref:invasion associated locus B family protein n=1 Tax=Stappia sp. TaxID=1870903 RepID=UPI000C8F0ED2|nr:invasion associated locus B family protein [Stappia sp.]